MALRTSATEDNRAVDHGKQVWYSRSMIHGRWEGPLGLMVTTLAWESHRYCNVSYKYVGMTYSAAQTKASALKTLYTRATKVSEWDGLSDFEVVDAGTELMAEIDIIHAGADAYDIIVNVREHDSRITTAPVDPSTQFTSEDSRQYDGVS